MVVKKKIGFVLCLIWVVISSCTKDELSDLSNSSYTFNEKLSSYHIYSGIGQDLTPMKGYYSYALGTTLFTDNAEKQRLIKLPSGTKMIKLSDDLPNFPDGTIIVKTFYYFHDKRDETLGKRIIETRLLIKDKGAWNVADYLWNESQTDAVLIEDGFNTSVNYINENGGYEVLNYHVPNNRECATCHSKYDEMVPIGPKLRNLNFQVETPDGTMNQIEYFQDVNIMENFDYTTISQAPSFVDLSNSLEDRARAYFDSNCAHCHRKGGFADGEANLYLDYESTFEETNIDRNKGQILNQLSQKLMPLIGTRIKDEKGIALIEEYINSL